MNHTKKITLVLITVLSCLFSFQTIAQNSKRNKAKKDNKETATEILQKAFKQAKKEKKHVMVKFTASWCGYCKRMDNKMHNEACKDLFDANYIVVQLVVLESSSSKNTPGAKELFDKYKGNGLPFWVIFDKKAGFVCDANMSNGENIGCPVTKEETDAFVQKLKKSSKLNAKELQVIHKVFYEPKK